MIHIETQTDHGEMHLVIENEEDIAQELAGILAVFREHFPEALAVALNKIDEFEADIEEDNTLDELFSECMKELDLMMKVRKGNNNAKS